MPANEHISVSVVTVERALDALYALFDGDDKAAILALRNFREKACRKFDIPFHSDLDIELDL